jgi:PAS domain S-box-containing protein
MRSARILIVEDDRIVARDIELQLTRIGHSVVGMTGRGEDALRLALSTQPELVLMDIRLEGTIDGVDAAEQIRQRCHVPVVFLTAYADDETVRRASLTEPFGYLLKPFEDTELRTVIEMALYKHGAERKLRESERRFVTTLSSIGDAVIATDSQARVTFMNPVAEALTGWPQSEAIGRPLPEVFHIAHEETRKTVEDPADTVMRLGTVAGLANHTILLARNGREIPIDDCSAPIIDDRGATVGAVLVFRDITQRRRSEEALRASQATLTHAARLTTMGELVVSIAHELNQPLMAIVTNAETCLQWLSGANPDLEEARKAAERVIRNGHRAGDVIASVRALVRKSSSGMTRLDMNGMITEIVDLMRAEIRCHEVVLSTELLPSVEPVWADRVQIEQVLVNLIMNAVEAMSLVVGRPRTLRISSESDGDNVLVAIADSGPGIELSKVDQIFESFFTTKPEGLGMGLSICRSILEAHRGRIWASQNLPHGSILRFTLPAAKIGSSVESSS